MTPGERLASVGLAEDAVAAFLRGQDVKAAIDCCVLLNQVYLVELSVSVSILFFLVKRVS
jgi:hypothetical protein